MRKYNLKNETMNELEIKKVYIYPIYPRESKICLDKGFVNIDNGSIGGSHWTRFLVKEKQSYFFDIFGGQPDEFLLNQLPKPKIYHNYKIQDLSTKLPDSYLFVLFLFN